MSVYPDHILLLQELIRTPSLSGQEDDTADIIEGFFNKKSIPCTRFKNNVWAKNQYFDPEKKSILLNSHHDTVKPNAGYTLDSFEARIQDNKLFGLGSNDAGGSLVALMATFLHFYEAKDLHFNLVLAATAEEEISGKNGIEALIPHLPSINLAIVGEPTLMQMAVAEKGLMVLDCTATGVAGHAAREEGQNAIYKAMEAISWFRDFRFEKNSASLGPIKMTTTLVHAGTQHNVVPDKCQFVVDVRLTDAFTIEETLQIIKSNVSVLVEPRSIRLKPSNISVNHPIVSKGLSLGLSTYGSPTLSDQALMPFDSIKIGPGDSARSHSSDEFIFINEIDEGIIMYIKLLENLRI